MLLIEGIGEARISRRVPSGYTLQITPVAGTVSANGIRVRTPGLLQGKTKRKVWVTQKGFKRIWKEEEKNIRAELHNKKGILTCMQRLLHHMRTSHPPFPLFAPAAAQKPFELILEQNKNTIRVRATVLEVSGCT